MQFELTFQTTTSFFYLVNKYFGDILALSMYSVKDII